MPVNFPLYLHFKEKFIPNISLRKNNIHAAYYDFVDTVSHLRTNWFANIIYTASTHG